MEADEVRKRLRDAIKEKGANAATLSLRLGRSVGYLSDFLRGKKATIAAADSAALERSLDLLPGALVVSVRSTTSGKLPGASRGGSENAIIVSTEALGPRDLPVYAATEGGSGEMVVSTDPVEMVARPWYLKNVKEGYAVLVTGESMEPRYYAGEIVIVNPKAALARTRDAIFHTAVDNGDFKAVLKVYLGSTAEHWRVRQHNPPHGQAHEFLLSKKDWPYAVRVVGRSDGS